MLIILFWWIINNSLYFHCHYLLGVSFFNFHQSFFSFLLLFISFRSSECELIPSLLWFIVMCFSYDFFLDALCLLLHSYSVGRLLFYIRFHPTPTIIHCHMKSLAMWNKFVLYVHTLLKPLLINIIPTHIWDGQIIISLWFSNHL